MLTIKGFEQVGKRKWVEVVFCYAYSKGYHELLCCMVDSMASKIYK